MNDLMTRIMTFLFGLIIGMALFFLFIQLCVLAGEIYGGMITTSILFVIGCFVFGYLGNWKESD